MKKDTEPHMICAVPYRLHGSIESATCSEPECNGKARYRIVVLGQTALLCNDHVNEFCSLMVQALSGKAKGGLYFD